MMWFSEHNLERPKSLTDLSVCQRIRLRREVDRLPEFRAEAGRTGAVTEIHQLQIGYLVCAQMDLPLTDDPLAQQFIDLKWGNAIQWYISGVDPFVALTVFLTDCELQESDFPAPGRRICLRCEVGHSPGVNVVPPGRTGTVVLVDRTPGDERIHARMDGPLSSDNAEQLRIEEVYGNCLQWYWRDELTSPLREFLADCEYIDAVYSGKSAESR